MRVTTSAIRLMGLLVACLFLFAVAVTAQFLTVPAGSKTPPGSNVLQTGPQPGSNAFTFAAIDFPGSSATTAAGINARGDIVGNYQNAGGNTHGFLLHQGVFSTIDFPGASLTEARAINARGDIVGRIVDSSGIEHGFLLHDGHFAQIDYPGASMTTARGINNAGDITGRHFDHAGNERGFILKDEVFSNVRVPGSCSTDVWLAMDNGQLLVGDFCTSSDGGIHGYVGSLPGNFQTIDFPGAGAPCTAPRWINERGDIAGVYANTLSECYAFQLHGFLLMQGQYTPLDFPGAKYTTLLAINDDGQTVGQYLDLKGVAHGFKASPINAQ
jgi:uncharacterized membrane protein